MFMWDLSLLILLRNVINEQQNKDIKLLKMETENQTKPEQIDKFQINVCTELNELPAASCIQTSLVLNLY